MLSAESAIRAGNVTDGIRALKALGPQPDRARELRRLWGLAMAHAHSNRPRAALPYLERLVSLSPENPNYRLELAAALDRGGQTDRARYHYDYARGAGLPRDLGQEIARRIERIDRSKNWEGRFEFALTPESNAARRTAEDTIIIGDLPFRLRPEARSKAAHGVKLGFGLTALPKLGADLRVRAGFNAEANLFEGEVPDDTQVTTEIGLVYFGDHSQRLGAGLLLGRRWIDGAAYSSSKGGYLTWGRSFGAEARSALSLTFLRDVTDFENVSLIHSTRTLGTVRLTHLLTSKTQLRASISLERSNSRLSWESGNRRSLTLGAQHAFRGGLIADLEVSTERLKRDVVDPFFGIQREDERYNIQLRLTQRDWVIRGFAPVVELGFEKQQSTNAIYSYENTRTAFGLTRRF